MGRHDPQFSADQRAAVVRHQLERGHTAPETVAAAAAGELGVPPFVVSESTCRRFAQQARKDCPRGVRERDNGQHDATDRVRAVAGATIARIEKLGDAATAKDLAALEQAGRIIQKGDRAAPRPEKPPENPAPAEMSPLLRGLLDQMREKDQARAEGRPCACDRPVPQSWDKDDRGWSICHDPERATAEQRRKEASRREWERINARRRVPPNGRQPDAT
jgi:hypothetical protein